MVGSTGDQYNRKKKRTKNEHNSWRNIEKGGGKHINQLNEGPEIKLHRVSRTQGRSNNCALLQMNFPTMEKSDVTDINKGGETVSITPYTQVQIRKMRQEWLERRPTPLFIFILPTFLCYHIHLPWRVDMYINLADYVHKGINIRYILGDWLLVYRWISPNCRTDGSVDWYHQGPQQWPLLVLLQHFLYPGPHCGCDYAWWIFCCVFL